MSLRHGYLHLKEPATGVSRYWDGEQAAVAGLRGEAWYGQPGAGQQLRLKEARSAPRIGQEVPLGEFALAVAVEVVAGGLDA